VIIETGSWKTATTVIGSYAGTDSMGLSFSDASFSGTFVASAAAWSTFSSFSSGFSTSRALT